MARNYRNRDAVFVTVLVGGVTVNYGFNSGMTAGDKTTLGQTVIDFAAPPTKLVMGANSPKPYKASKRGTTGYSSSFCSHTTVATLKGAGWTITPPKSRTATSTTLSDTYYVNIGGIKYAWNSPKKPTAITDENLTALGVTKAGASDEDLIFGASMPKPARYRKELTGGTGEGTNNFSIFVEPTKEDDAITAGFVKMKSRKLFTTVAG